MLLLELALDRTLSNECSQTILCNLSKFCVDWKLIGKCLGLTEAEITAVDGDNRTVEEKRVGMLKKWKGKFAYRATYHMLIESLFSWGSLQMLLKHAR